MSSGAMIAFLPVNTDWCKQDLPHMTLVYGGDIVDLPAMAFNDMAKDGITIARMLKPFALEVTGVEVFGDEPKVDVLTLEMTPDVRMARNYVKSWDKSEHGFNPHATIGPEGSADGILPSKLYFEEVLVAWGDRHLKFALGRY